MNAFDYAAKETLGLEGGNSNDPDDRGGETNYGVTQKTLQDALNRGIISGIKHVSQLTPDLVKTIFKEDYWKKIQLDKVYNLFVAAEIFDTAVNSGPGKAVIIAQMALDYLGEVVTIDGVMGPQTISLLNKWGARDERALLVALNGFQFIHFVLIVDDKDLIDKMATMVRASSDQTKFSRGWTKRVSFYREKL